MRAMFRPYVVLVLIAGLCAIAVPGARADDTPPPPVPAITWVAPSPASGSVIKTLPGTPGSISVAAAYSDAAAVVHTTMTGPDGAIVAVQEGNPATAAVSGPPAA